MKRYTIALTPYVVRVGIASDTKDHTKSEFSNIYDLLIEYMDLRKKEAEQNDKKASVIRVSESKKSEKDKKVYGTFSAGKYGFASELYNIETEETINREINDCEMLPFYFLFNAKKDENEAILLLQTFGVYGVKDSFHIDFNNFVKSKNENAVLTIHALTRKDSFKECLAGKMKKIRYSRHKVPSDWADRLKLDSAIMDDVDIEIVVKPRRNRILKFKDDLSKFLNGDGRKIKMRTGIAQDLVTPSGGWSQGVVVMESPQKVHSAWQEAKIKSGIIGNQVSIFSKKWLPR